MIVLTLGKQKWTALSLKVPAAASYHRSCLDLETMKGRVEVGLYGVGGDSSMEIWRGSFHTEPLAVAQSAVSAAPGGKSEFSEADIQDLERHVLTEFISGPHHSCLLLTKGSGDGVKDPAGVMDCGQYVSVKTNICQWQS